MHWYSPLENHYLQKCISLFSDRKQTWVAKQLNEVNFYGSWVCRSQIADHANNFCYFTKIWKTRFSYQKSLNKKYNVTHFFDWIKPYLFTWKNGRWKQKRFKYKYILIECKHIFLNNKIFNWKKEFFSLHINIYYFKLKKYWIKNAF